MSIPRQIDLITAISRSLAEQGFGEVNTPRQLNAIVEAADLIVREFRQPHEPARPGSGLAAWLRSDDTGLSSRAMAIRLAPLAGIDIPVLAGRTGDGTEHPSDPDDFGRAVRLLEAVPVLRPHLPAMADVSEVWARLVGAWDELEGLYREESPKGRAPKLFRRMQALIYPEAATR